MAVNGVYIVMGEANTVVALLTKARRQYQLSHQPPSLEDTDPLMRNFADLKEVLNAVSDLSGMNPITYLSPFLDVIKAQNTNGPITEAALSSVAKFLTYGLIDASSIRAGNAVNSIADAVVHTKFIGGKSSGGDECVLYKILLVLRSLLLSPSGALLSNEAVCSMMQSCFKIFFELNLSPLLRKAAEATLTDTTQLIFTRLSTFREDTRHPYIRYLVMNSKGEKRRHRAHEIADSDQEEDRELPSLEKDPLISEERKGSDTAASQLGYDVVTTSQNEADEIVRVVCEEKIDEGEVADAESEDDEEERISKEKEKSRPVASNSPSSNIPTAMEQMPYGLPCCRELLRFLIALTNPLDRANTESMVTLGLNLITVALEAAADHLIDYPVLMPLIRDNLCRSLLQLLDTEKLPVLAATNRVCFLLFESMRNQLKFQLEAYFHKLKAIIRNEQAQNNTNCEQKEMALESLVQLWRIPGLVTELYLNYDCDLYSTNLFEDLTELLKDMSFPMSGLGNTSLLALDALLVVIDTIDENCLCRQNISTMDYPSCKTSLQLPILSGMEIGKKIIAAGSAESVIAEDRETFIAPVAHANRHAPSTNIPLLSDVIQRKERKRILAEGTDIFNKDPKQGINFLREKGILGPNADSVVQWLRTNPQLDKKKIAEYICSRKHAEVLAAFVRSFPFENTRLDEALRIFLESFRLPGEAAEISMIMQHFSEQWYTANNEPFNHVDAAFTLSYAVIMLNMDQHNPQVRRSQPPMTVDCFRRNLSGTNGGQDFDQDMLVAMYNAIKSEEIVMPAEQTGIVKENYLWKVLLRRGETTEGVFLHAPTGWNDHSLFSLIWGPTISTLSYVFGKTDHEVILKRALNGFRKCASIAAFFGMENVFDNLVITLCKFSTFTMKEATGDVQDISSRGVEIVPNTPEAIAILFGENHKAQEALRVLFELVNRNGDILRESWTNMIHTLLALFQAHLLPPDLTEVADFVDEKGWVSIVRTVDREPQPIRNEAGLLSWFGLGSGGSESEKKKPTQDQMNAIKLAKDVVKDCCPSQLIRDSKYLTASALKRLIGALRDTSKHLLQQKKKRGESEVEHEDMLVFIHEFIVSITLENKDRIAEFWPDVKEHILPLLSLNKYPVLVERAVVGILRIANRILFRDNSVADDVLAALSHFLKLPEKAMFVFSRQISNGLYELLHNNAKDIHIKDHWDILLDLMQRAGASRLDYVEHSPHGDRHAYSDVERPAEKLSSDDRGYTSDNYLDRSNRLHSEISLESRADSAVSIDQTKDWIHLDKKDAERAIQDAQRTLSDSKAFNRASLVLRTHLGRHEPAAFLKVCDCLDFILRESAPHITPENLESSINCLLTMVEASLDGGRYAAGPISGDAQNSLRSNVEERKRHKHKAGKKELSTDVPDSNETPSEEQQLSASYQQASLHLLDLCSNLHNCAYGKLDKWAKEDPTVNNSIPYVWATVWCPLLQVMARLACDCRRRVREIALAQLQRSFLNMGNLGSKEWESCFNEVLFPLLTKLLEPFSAMDPLGREDTRVRAIQIVAKTLLNRLKELSALPSFPTLWLRLLDFMEKYLRIDTHGTLNEAVPESLKNMLLVLDNSGLFTRIPGLYELTTQRINPILPQLIRDTIPNPPQAQNTRPTGSRIQIAPAIPSHEVPPITISPKSQPSEIPEIPLTEVIVHSGAASPVFPPHSPETRPPPPTEIFEQQSPSSSTYEAPPASTVPHSVQYSDQVQQTYAQNPYFYPYTNPQSVPLHTPQYSSQQIMPQADLSKVWTGGQAPQFLPPQELLSLQSSYVYSQQLYTTNPLPMTHPSVQSASFVQSPNSAFQPIAPDSPKYPQHERP